MPIKNKLKLTDYNVTDLILSKYKEIYTNSTITSGILNIDLNQGNVFLITLNENITTINILNVPNLDNIIVAFTLVLTISGSGRVVSWPSNVKWQNSASAVVTQTDGKKDFFSFITMDKGVNWFGFIGGQNY